MSLVMWKPRPSRAGMAVARALGIRVFRDMQRLNRWLDRNGDARVKVINWGNITCPYPVVGRVLNRGVAVYSASNKFESNTWFRRENIPSVLVTRSGSEASEWLNRDRRTVFLRRDFLSAGKGIRVIDPLHPVRLGDLDRQHFYSRYYPKTHEFRVHVGGGRAIDIVEKKARHGVPRTSLIRNHANGWVFAHENFSLNTEDLERLKTLAIQAVNVLTLDFGAVDILVRRNPQTGRIRGARICEVNSAPGLENTATLSAYINYFREVART